jgi:curli biogenesis system outer membrane secretion channel CsgG
MRHRVTLIWLLLNGSLLWIGVFGCTATKPAVTPAAPSQMQVPPESEKTKVIVLRLENKTRKGKKDESTSEDRLFGNGIRAQIVNALEQSRRFTVVENEGPRKVLQSDAVTDSGEIRKATRSRLGSFGDAEFLVAGTLQTYQLSQESKNAGIDADLLFRESQAQAIDATGGMDSAKGIFENLKPKDTDRVEIELWLFDVKTAKRIALITIQGVSGDSGEVIGGMFGQQLASVSGEPKTPMQRALRGSAIKAVNWIAEQGEKFRTQAQSESPPSTQKKPSHRSRPRSKLDGEGSKPSTTGLSPDGESNPGSIPPAGTGGPTGDTPPKRQWGK